MLVIHFNPLYFTSMNSRKLYKCKECGREVAILSKGLCPGCRSKQLPKKAAKPIRMKSKKKEVSYTSFYEKCLEELHTRKFSDYSGKPIVCPTVCNVCHILPKRKYKSVAEDRANIFFLTDEEHTEYDRLMDTLDFETMKSKMPDLYYMTIGRFRSMFEASKIEERGKLTTRLMEICGDEFDLTF